MIDKNKLNMTNKYIEKENKKKYERIEVTRKKLFPRHVA